MWYAQLQAVFGIKLARPLYLEKRLAAPYDCSPNLIFPSLGDSIDLVAPGSLHSLL